jgi:hypothetical protein
LKAKRVFRGRRLPWRKIKPNRRHLEEYEERIILRDLLLLLGDRDHARLGAVDLMRAHPDRYDRQLLIRALTRMYKKGLLPRGRRLRIGGTTYLVTREERKAA